MSKLVKDLITRELESRYKTQDNAVWVEIVGVDGITTNEFRRDLCAHGMKLEVVKTSLLRRACAGGPFERLAAEVAGPAAMVTGGDTAIEVAKLLDEWKAKFPKDSFRVRGALLDGEYIAEARAQDLHKMASKQDLQARIVSIVLAPGRNIVGLAVAPGRNVVGIVKQIAEKLEQGEEIKALSN